MSRTAEWFKKEFERQKRVKKMLFGKRLSHPGEIWRCNDTEPGDEYYMVTSDKYGKVNGECWLSDGTCSSSRGHVENRPDKDQELVAKNLREFLQKLRGLSPIVTAAGKDVEAKWPNGVWIQLEAPFTLLNPDGTILCEIVRDGGEK